jgi:hypothetical protein
MFIVQNYTTHLHFVQEILTLKPHEVACLTYTYEEEL